MSPDLLARANQHREAGNWLDCLFTYDRPLRSAVFAELASLMSDREYWEALHEIWEDTEFPTRSRAFWLFYFLWSRPQREHLMTAEDHTAFAALPDPVTLYRGATSEFRRGLSWTTDVERAAWFARRFAFQDGHVYTLMLPKRKLLAYFCGRNEAEAVIDPRRVTLAELAPKAAGKKGE